MVFSLEDRSPKRIKMKNKKKTPFSRGVLISSTAMAPTRSFPKAFQTGIGRLSGFTCDMLSEIHGHAFGSLPRAVAGLALPSLWVVRVPRPRITAGRRPRSRGCRTSHVSFSLASPQTAPPSLVERRDPGRAVGLGGVCGGPPLLCDLGEVTGALWDQFLTSGMWPVLPLCAQLS